jgi:hypothetical protein
MIGLRIELGRRCRLQVSTTDWVVELDGGDDWEGGLTATACISRYVRLFGRSDLKKWLGVHAANGKHSRWVWFDVAGQRQIGQWRVAWWLPNRRDPASEIPPLLAEEAPLCEHGCGPMRKMAVGWECVSDHK